MQLSHDSYDLPQVPVQADGQTPSMIALAVDGKFGALLLITGALSITVMIASLLLLITRDKKFVNKEKLSYCNRKYGDN